MASLQIILADYQPEKDKIKFVLFIEAVVQGTWGTWPPVGASACLCDWDSN